MYKPISETTVNELYLNDTMKMLSDTRRSIITGYFYPYNFIFSQHPDPACSCYIQWAAHHITADGLDIDPSKEDDRPAWQELLLILSIRKLIEFTINNDREQLIIFFDNPMLQLVLLDHGFSIRNSKGHERRLYRAKKRVKNYEY